MTLWQVGVTDMNTIFLLHVGQLGNTGGSPLEDTPAAGMSAPPYLVRVCGVNGRCGISRGSAEGSLTFFRVARRSTNHLFRWCTWDRAGRSRHTAAPVGCRLWPACFIVFWHLGQTAGEDWI